MTMTPILKAALEAPYKRIKELEADARSLEITLRNRDAEVGRLREALNDCVKVLVHDLENPTIAQPEVRQAMTLLGFGEEVE